MPHRIVTGDGDAAKVAVAVKVAGVIALQQPKPLHLQIGHDRFQQRKRRLDCGLCGDVRALEDVLQRCEIIAAVALRDRLGRRIDDQR